MGDGAVDAHPPANGLGARGLLETVEEGPVGRDEVHPGSDEDYRRVDLQVASLLVEPVRPAGVAAVEAAEQSEFLGRPRRPRAQSGRDAAMTL